MLRGGALLTVAVWLALFKPNLALIPVLLAAHLAARFGRAAAAMCAVALAAGLALAALPCLYFGSFAVWTDWLGAIGGENAGRLVFPVADGNYATVRIALEVLGLAPAAAAAGLATLVAVAVIFAARGPRGLARALRSPDVSLALAVSVTLAIAPLLWLHYYVIAVCPALWLLSRPGAAPHLGGLGLLLSSGALSGLAAFAGAPAAIPLLHALCWPALVGGTLLEVRRAAHPDPARPC